LGRESAEELLTALLEDAVEVPLKRLIFERTGGNPFFIEEIVQADLRAGEFIYEHPAATATCRQTAAASGGSLRQEQPLVPGMLDEPSAGLHQPLLQARQRPDSDPRRQRQQKEIRAEKAQHVVHVVTSPLAVSSPRDRLWLRKISRRSL
jgi:hypothetical protein